MTLHVLELEIVSVADRLVVSASERDESRGPPISILETRAIPRDQIDELADEVFRLLALQRDPAATQRRLEQLGLQLFDGLFGTQVKRLIRRTRAHQLVLRLQSTLLAIPWELCHSGDDFLCLRFAIGRVIKLEASVLQPVDPLPPLHFPLRLLIICDPKADLPEAAKEGRELFRQLSRHKTRVSADLIASSITTRQVIDELRRYSVVHYAGHAISTQEEQRAGWLLEDGTFSVREIRQMQESGRFPSLIVANACLSAAASAQALETLPGALLQAGVQHYIGVSSDLPDTSGKHMAMAFYDALLAGKAVGESLRVARILLFSSTELPALAWAGYVLYGDPGFGYTAPDTMADPTTPVQPSDRKSGHIRLPLQQSLPPMLVGAFVGAAAGVAGFSGATERLDALWEAGRYLFQNNEPHFRTPMSLFALSYDQVPNARAHYAALLEHLYRADALPKTVAFDTWLEHGRKTEFDLRLMQAVADVLERFPVIFGLEADRRTGQVSPPPDWFIRGVGDALVQKFSAQCEQARAEQTEVDAGLSAAVIDPPSGITPARPSCPSLQVRQEKAQEWLRARLLFGSVRLERPSWVFRQYGWRVLMLRPSEKDELAQMLEYRHFADLLAFPERGGLEPSSREIRLESGAMTVNYDHRGTIPVIFEGRASWNAASNFPAYDLSEVLETWDTSTASTQLPLYPRDLNQQRILVGLAEKKARGNEMDLYQTPLGEMFGVEILGNVTESLVQRQVPRPVAAGVSIGLASGAGAIGAAIGAHSSQSRVWQVVAAFSVTALALSYVVLWQLNLAWTPASFVLALLGGSLITRSWRRLATAGLVVLIAGTMPDALAQPVGALKSGGSPTIKPPAPPTVPPRAVAEEGWWIRRVRPAGLQDVGAIMTDGGPARAGMRIAPGVTLRSTNADAEVVLEFRDPNTIVSHLLWGVFEATLGSGGELQIRGGSIWSRIFHSLESSLEPLRMTYDGRPAGFGSTEVAYRHEEGFRRSGWLFVLEGQVLMPDLPMAAPISERIKVRWGSGKPQHSPIEATELKRWIERGTDLELEILASLPFCAKDATGIKSTALVTAACYGSVQGRDEALRMARTALTVGASAGTWYSMGNAYLAAGDLVRARDSYERGLKAGGTVNDRAQIYLELGNTLWQSGDAEGAKRAFEAATVGRADLAAAWNNLGVLEWQAGRVDRARAALEKAVGLDPAFLLGLKNLGRIVYSGNPSLAVQYWERASSLTTLKDDEVYRDLGLGYAALGQYDKAVGAMKRSIELAPGQAVYWYQLGQWYFEQGRNAEGLDAYNRAMEIEARSQEP